MSDRPHALAAPGGLVVGGNLVLLACWSAKGGSGTTVVASGLALIAGRRHTTGALLADLAGDAPTAMGIAEPEGPGLAGWLAGGATVPADALARLEVPVAAGVHVLPRGAGELDPARAGVLATLLASDPRTVVADCGTSPGGAAAAVLAGADRSVLVTRQCYLAVRRAAAAGHRPTDIVLVHEPGRALAPGDVEEVLRAPVVAQLHTDPAVARAVDAGLLGRRLPRSLDRALRHVAA